MAQRVFAVFCFLALMLVPPRSRPTESVVTVVMDP
jgi:hypothetical protein